MDLREKTIELIRSQGVDMSNFGATGIGQLPDCGTICCLAGTICIAAQELGITPVLSLLGLELWVPACARNMWSQVYGKLESERLEFYEQDWLVDQVDEDDNEISGARRREVMKTIPPEDVIRHILGEAPTKRDPAGFIPGLDD